ncbi:MAG: UbiA family prenyltransferase [Candidatus Krumholzibacteria bacterium]
MLTTAILRLCDYLFVLRPLILIPAWSFYLIGAAQGRTPEAGWSMGFPSPPVFLSLTTILITAYLLNQVFDRESDEKNDKCFYLARRIFHARTLIILAIASFLIASTFFKQVQGTRRALLLGALLLSLFYSLPPLRLCARPFVDMLANAAGYGGLAYILGYGIYQPVLDTVAAASPFVLLVAATFLHTAILDVEGDRDTGKTSTAVFLGGVASRRLAAVLHLSAVIAAILTHNGTALIITGVLAPMNAYAIVRAGRETSAILVQVNTAVVAVAAVASWPAYALLVAPIVLLSRFYYKKRFGIIYPGPQKTA